MNPHPSVEQFRRLAAGQLSPVEQEAVEVHVNACAPCQEALARLLDEEANGSVAAIERLLPQLDRLTSGPEMTGPFLGRLQDHPPAAQTPESEAGGEEALPKVPGYEILGVLGRGGMGVVYKAHHLQLKRLVALKMIKAGVDAAPHELERFRVEAEAVARMQHPNIVQVHEVGAVEGRPFFALEYVEGGSLKDKLGGASQPPRQAAQLVETLARATHAAHQRGIIHRDLKPANVLLTVDGTPKVTDFGLAKRLDAEAGPTQSGAILGTPSYMAPEQVRGKSKELGPAADVWSLGAILYELLTGRPPFRAANDFDTLMLVLDHEPERPHKLNPEIPPDLETICLKCLEKWPERRYAAAAELADDLKAFVDCRPIRARPVGRLERTWLWCRRKPVVAGLSAAAAVLLLLVGVMVGVSYSRGKTAEEAQEIARLEKVAREKANEDAAKTEQINRDLDELAKLRDKLRLEAEENARQERANKRQLDYFEDMRQAARHAEEERFEPTLALLEKWRPQPGEPDERAWEWYYLQALAARASLVTPAEAAARREEGVYFALPGHGRAIRRLSWSLDGARLASYDEDGLLKVWDLITGKETASRKLERIPAGRAARRGDAWSPDGRQLAVVEAKGAVTVLDAATGRALAAVPALPGKTPAPSGDTTFRQVAWSPDGRRLAVSSSESVVRVFDADTGKEALALRGHGGAVVAVAWSVDGKHLASGSTDGQVKVWDMTAGREAFTLVDEGAVAALAWRLDGRQLAASFMHFNEQTGIRSQVKGTTLWDVAERKVLWRMPGEGAHHSDDLLWSPDGGLLGIGAGTSELTPLLDVATGRVVFRGPRDCFRDPEQRRAAVLHSPGAALLELPGGQMFGMLVPWLSSDTKNSPGYEAASAVAWDRDGKRLALGSTQGNIQVLNAPQRDGACRTLCLPSRVARSVSWSPDGRRFLALGGNPPSFRLYALPLDGPQPRRDEGEDDAWRMPTDRMRLSPDGKRLAVAYQDRSLLIWDVAAGRVVQRLAGHRKYKRGIGSDKPLTTLLWSPTGKHLATRDRDGTVKVWDTDTGWEVLAFDPGRHSPSMVWNPDGTQLALVLPPSQQRLEQASVEMWDVASGRLVRTLMVEGMYRTPVWSPDGKFLAAGRRLWDAATGKLVTEVPLKGSEPSLGWSPDSRRLAWVTSHDDGGVYDRETGKTIPLKTGSGYALFGVTWSPDGKQVAYTNGVSVHIHDTATGERQPTPKSLFGYSLVWTPEGLIGVQPSPPGIGHPLLLVTNAATGKIVKLGEVVPRAPLEARVVAWRPDGRQFALGGNVTRNSTNFTEVRIHDADSGKEVQALEVKDYGATHLAWSPDGTRLAVVGTKLAVWNVATGQWERELPGSKLVNSTGPLDRGEVALAWNADGRRLALTRLPEFHAGNAPATITVWDVAAGKVEQVLKGEPSLPNAGLAPTLAWSPDSKYVAGAGNRVRVWEVVTGKEVFQLLGHSGMVSSLQWSPDGRRLISRSREGRGGRPRVELKVWDATSGQEVIGVSGLVAELEFSPTLHALYQFEDRSSERTLTLWDLTPPRDREVRP